MDEFFVRNRLSAYIDGELPSAEAREVESTLARSPSLRAEYEALRAAVNLLREHGPLVAPDGFDARLQERLAREPMPTGWRRWVRAIRPEVALIAAVAAIAILYVAQNPGEPAPTATTSEGVAVSPPVAAADPTEPALKEQSGVDPSADKNAVLPRAADGILGDEGFAAARNEARQQRAEGPPQGAYVPRVPSSGAEREPYQPAWVSSGADVQIIGTNVQVKPGGVADPTFQEPAAPSTAIPQTSSNGATTLYSPPPFRYRVRSTDEATHKALEGIAVSLGGHLVDAQGRPVAVHMLDQGEVKTVRVLVPSSRVEALTNQLRALGDVEIMAADRSGLYASGTEVPVQVELERE